MNVKFQMSNFKCQIIIGNWKFEIGNYLKLPLVFFLFAIIASIFFYPIFKGHIPFPGDLLVGNSGPYNSESYNGYAPGGVPHKAQGPDVLRQLYPWKFFAIESLKQMQIPYWNPHNFSGNPLMANFQSAVFYPLNLLFFLLPFNDAWTFFILLIPMLAAFFTYVYLREIEISTIPSIFAGIVFAFSAYMIVWMEYGNIGHTLLWLPLGLYVTEKLVKKFDKRYILLLLLVLVVAVLGGYIQGYFYSVGFLGFYFISKRYMEKKLFYKTALLFFLVLILPIFLTFFQFLPTLDLYIVSSRGHYSLESIQQLLNPWWYIVTVIAPDFFGHPASRNHWFYGTYIERVSFFGVIPFILALFSISYYKKKKEIVIFGLLMTITVLLAFDFKVTKYVYLIPIPVISTTVPTRILSLFAFAGALLSGVGLHFLLQEKRWRFLPYVLVGLLLISAWNIALFGSKLFPQQDWTSNLLVSQRNLLIPSLLIFLFGIFHILLLSKKKLTVIFIFAICLLTAADLFRFFHKITPFSPQEYVYPKTPVVSYIQKNAGINRYWGYGSGRIDTNFQLYDHTYHPDGNDPLHIRSYTEFVESSADGKIPESLPRPDASIAPGFGNEDLRNNRYRQKVLNILGVKYVLHKNNTIQEKAEPDVSTFDDKVYTLVWQKAPWQIYENLHVAPRFFLTTDYLVIPDKEKLLTTFYSASFDEKKTILLKEDPLLSKTGLRVKSTKLITYTPNKVVFETNSDADALLFLSDTYYPFWKAKVDEKETKVFVADYAFRAVKIPKGMHSVQFYYDPQSFKKGLGLSIMLVTLLFLLYMRLPVSLEKEDNKR